MQPEKYDQADEVAKPVAGIWQKVRRRIYDRWELSQNLLVVVVEWVSE